MSSRTLRALEVIKNDYFCMRVATKGWAANLIIAMRDDMEGVVNDHTWDSLSRGGLAAYEADKESATVARDALEGLLLDLSNVDGVHHIHILAHSMGAWLAMESLRGVATAGRPNLGGKLGEVMLAAPDIDVSVFSQQLQRVGPEHVTSLCRTPTGRSRSLRASPETAPALGPWTPATREAERL
jgi:esterase/lipase superfamily enzyme